MKKSFAISVLILLLSTIVLFFAFNIYIYTEKQEPNNNVVNENNQIIQESDPKATTTPDQLPDLKIRTFTGELQEVNVGCFVDGECYVVVDGIHVTALLGWTNKIVGTVKGVEGFGDLENFIGEKVEVYAQDLGDGTYSLYGSEEFYIKTLTSGGASARLFETVSIFDTKITPLEILEDSRCPIDVQCIQAGTVRLRANFENLAGKSEQIFVLGEPVVTELSEIKLLKVEPITNSQTTIAESEYTFYFQVKQK